MADNLVSQPPLQVPMQDQAGRLSKAWSIWFRDLYNRVAYKGGNAIDDNAGIIDDTIDTLDEAIIAIFQLDQALLDHEGEETAHGSNGNIVGFSDIATELLYGLVKRMALISDAANSTVSVVVSDVGAAPAAYSQSHSQALADLTNANKSAINTLVTDVNAAIDVLNDLLAKSRISGQMTT